MFSILKHYMYYNELLFIDIIKIMIFDIILFIIDLDFLWNFFIGNFGRLNVYLIG